MSLTDSPDFSDLENVLEGDDSPDDSGTAQADGQGRQWLQGVFFVLGLFAVLLTGLNVYQSFAVYGTIEGYVRDTDGRAIRAEVLIMGSYDFVYTDESGYFIVEQAPIGRQDLVINYNNLGQTYAVDVPSMGHAFIGNLVFDTDAQRAAILR